MVLSYHILVYDSSMYYVLLIVLGQGDYINLIPGSCDDLFICYKYYTRHNATF